MEIDLSTGTPPSPGHSLHLAETFAEIARVLNHQTMDQGAIGSPEDAERLLRELAAAAARLPQLCDQVGRWVATEDRWGCIQVPSGEWAGDPAAAVAAFRERLDAASATAAALGQDLERAAQVTRDMTGVEDGGADDA